TVAIVITVAIMCQMLLVVRVAAFLLHLTRRHVAIAPAFFLSLVPASGALVVVAILALVVVAIMMLVFVSVLVKAAVPMATFRVGRGRQGQAEHQSHEELQELGSHWGTLLPA